jgi:hypothetical protein
MDEDEVGEDIGYGHELRFFSWSPDRELNPQYEGIPDCDRAGLIVLHPGLTETDVCMSSVNFDSAPEPVIRNRPTWHVESWEPFTLSPSLLCRRCGDHGFIQNGRWVPA